MPLRLPSQSGKTIPGSIAVSTRPGAGSHVLPKTEHENARLPQLPLYRRVSGHECHGRQDVGTLDPRSEISWGVSPALLR